MVINREEHNIYRVCGIRRINIKDVYRINTVKMINNTSIYRLVNNNKKTQNLFFFFCSIH